MQNPTRMFFVALAVLLLTHSLVSFLAYRLLTVTKVQSSTAIPPVETTTPEQQARGITTLTLGQAEVVERRVPMPVILYILFGYAGLLAAVVYSVYFRIRYGQ